MTWGQIFEIAFTAAGWICWAWCAHSLMVERELSDYLRRHLDATKRAIHVADEIDKQVKLKLGTYKPDNDHHFRRW